MSTHLELLDIYKVGIHPLLFKGLKADPEWLHQQTLQVLSRLEQIGDRPFANWVLAQLEQSCCIRNTHLEQTLWGLKFPNPIGLAAGFDKDGVAASVWQHLGFGFAELGTVTFHAQPGNLRPRLFRLPKDQAALNRMGFNNQGAAALAEQLRRSLVANSTEYGARGMGYGEASTQCPIPIGVNLGKSKVTPLAEASSDYLSSFRLLRDLGDYFVVNVSSPNTPGLRSLQSAEHLSSILDTIQQENQGQKPLLVKIAPDLEWEEIEAIAIAAQTYQLAGMIATNTTIRRDGLKTQLISQTGKSVCEEAGGISGAPLRDRSTEVIRFIWQQTKGDLPIIGVGGIFTAEDAWEKIVAGASLIQVYTGWVYEGPWMVRRILDGLLQKLQEQGLASIADAVGLEKHQDLNDKDV